MQAKKRYALVLSTIFTTVFYFTFFNHIQPTIREYSRGAKQSSDHESKSSDSNDSSENNNNDNFPNTLESSWNLNRAKDVLFTNGGQKHDKTDAENNFDSVFDDETLDSRKKLHNRNSINHLLPTLINHPDNFFEPDPVKTLAKFGRDFEYPKFEAFPSAFNSRNILHGGTENLLKFKSVDFRTNENLQNHENPQNNDNINIPDPRTCTIDKCFDMFKCSSPDLKVYIYPEAFENSKYKKSTQWTLFERIIYIIKQSQFYTPNPQKACVFIIPFDTLVRDRLDDNYIERLQEKVQALPHWNQGRNHLFFNLYAGTWPDYAEDLNFDYGYAVMAKASFSREFYRPGFDISLPLFKKEQTFFKGVEKVDSLQNLYPSKRKYLITFKGKRYLTGIGSVTRNLLYQIDNEPERGDVIMLTTCKHGKDWEKFADARCDKDNARYDSFDYQELMINSTFCLVPRGRRLGSFRFLESLRATCVPVVMADSWVLPFEEILDWSGASLNFDERDYIVSPMVLRHVGDKRIFELRQQGVFFYHAYFSSLERIVLTSLEIIRERVYPHHKKPNWVWNHGEGISGALATFSSKSVNYDLDYPFYNADLVYSDIKLKTPKSLKTQSKYEKTPKFENSIESEKFVQSDQRYSAVIQVVAPQVKALTKVLVALDKSKSCGQVLLIWNMKNLPVKVRKRLESFKKVEIIPAFEKLEQFDDISAKFGEYVQNKIRFNGVLSLDDDVKLISDEMEYAFEVWRMEKSRIVGFPNRLHYWLQGSMSDADGRIQKITRWAYTSKFHNEYSLVLSGAAFLHKFYLNTYSNGTNIGGHSISRSVVNKYKNCEDILINFVVADLTGKPPIKITQRKRYKNTETGQNEQDANTYGLDLTAENAPLAPRWTEKAHFQERQICMNKFFEDFGYMPLMTSQLRLDPTLYKDNVAAWRKQYKSIEIVGDE